MSVSVRVTSKLDIEGYKKKLRRAMTSRLRMVGRSVVSTVRKNISVDGKSFGPSRPGEYPHRQTGELMRSVESQVSGSDQAVSVFIRATAPHAETVEEKRPFMRRTIAEMEHEIYRQLTEPLNL